MKISKKILSNGLRVVTIHMADNPTATVLVLSEAGSKYESKKDNGISHFLEHMCFKGTKNRPGTVDISRELDSLGSSYNAFTGHEYTGYYAKADSRHFKKIFDLVSDIYLNPLFPEVEMEKEKGVIVEEINMYEDLPQKHIEDLLMKLLYGETPAGRNILGTKESVRRIRRSDLVQYRSRHYLPKSTVLAVAGDVSEKEVLKEARKIFGKMKGGKKSGKPKVQENQKKPAVILQYKDTGQAHFMFGFRSYGIFDKRAPVLSLLSSVLSGGMSSRLFVRLREEMGAGYYVRSDNNTFTDHGFFEISAGVDKGRLEEALQAVLAECRRLSEEEVPKAELDKAKEILISGMKFSLESTDDVAGFFGGQEILKRKISTAEQKAKKIRSITSREIKRAAKGIFNEKNLNLAVIGPFRQKGSFLKILKL